MLNVSHLSTFLETHNRNDRNRKIRKPSFYNRENMLCITLSIHTFRCMCLHKIHNENLFKMYERNNIHKSTYLFINFNLFIDVIGWRNFVNFAIQRQSKS